MSFKLKTVASKVRTLLEVYPSFRDNDTILMTSIWRDELETGTELSINTLAALFINKRLSKPDTITRARRKLQELHPELRGTKWDERHRAEKPFVKELKEID